MTKTVKRVRGWCPTCGRRVDVNLGGLVGAHYEKGRSVWCGGVYTKAETYPEGAGRQGSYD